VDLDVFGGRQSVDNAICNVLRFQYWSSFQIFLSFVGDILTQDCHLTDDESWTDTLQPTIQFLPKIPTHYVTVILILLWSVFNSCLSVSVSAVTAYLVAEYTFNFGALGAACSAILLMCMT
jgi:magnesium-transporting ATPase (P-type)